MALFVLNDIIRTWALIIISTKYLWKRRSSVSSGWNDVIMIFPCLAATILSSTFTENKMTWMTYLGIVYHFIKFKYIRVNVPFTKDGFCVLPEPLASVARTFTCSLSSIDTIPGARMKIPLKRLISSIWVVVVIVPFKALHAC